MTLNELLRYIEDRLGDRFPENTAPVPISWAKEREPHGKFIYAAYIEVHTDKDDFDTRGTSTTDPQVAVARAWTRLATIAGIRD